MKTWSWRQGILKTELESPTKLVLLALSTYMNEHGEGCYPSAMQIARDTSLSLRAVYAHIQKAEIAGFLVRDKRELRGRKWAANEYRAALPSETEPQAAPKAEMNVIHPTSWDAPHSPHEGLRDAPGAVEGCTTFSRGMHDVHTNSPKNTPLNSTVPDAKFYPQALKDDWHTVLHRLSGKCGEAVYRSWLSHLRFGDRQGSTLTLSVSTRFIAEWINGHYAADILQAARSVWPEIAEVRIVCGPSK